MNDDPLRLQYDALKTGAGFVELENRCCVRLTGEDRQSFFHNFCTNDIKRLDVGDTCEAFVLNSKGKILGFVHAVASGEELLLIGHGDQAQTLIQHLEMYLIRDDVTLSDASAEFSSFFVCGATAAEKLQDCSSSLPAENRFGDARFSNVSTKILNLELAGFGYLLLLRSSDARELKATLLANEVTECSSEALEILRIEHKTPWFGIDVDVSNLPQELQRDEKAISFDKGCYLGQETVARIDARGRVNQLLVGLKFNGAATPGIGHELTDKDATVGRVTSVAHSYALGSQVGLGYVRRKFRDEGTELQEAVVLG